MDVEADNLVTEICGASRNLQGASLERGSVFSCGTGLATRSGRVVATRRVGTRTELAAGARGLGVLPRAPDGADDG